MVLGLAPSSTAYLWWSVTAAVLLGLAACIGSVVALAILYESARPFRFKGVWLCLGTFALIALYFVGPLTVRDVTLELTGTETDAVVAKAWTTHNGKQRHKEQHHCTLMLPDGTPLTREFGSNCAGHDPGDTIPIVYTPGSRFPAVNGPKTDMHTVGEVQVTGTAALILLIATALGSRPKHD
ncbi:hypothetical protein HUT06_38340 [Actinomadura sp. NAK00032]|uniref:hypothetical protein n=1 Tax=Actinomadura sp. NAK00032 TaxID=2742128 RepID=UPI0015916184|nr:hypothetical protein [Actinomadura sp. NAK00032]QKW39168.1 hypothetical protein HUT06_38340 [Actinomadura sp. NAK00032]